MVYLILHKSLAVSHRVSPSRAPVLSFAHYFQAPATQAIKLRLAITFILNAVNPGSKCTKDVTPLEKLTNSVAAAAMVGFYGAVVIVPRAAFPVWWAGIIDIRTSTTGPVTHFVS